MLWKNFYNSMPRKITDLIKPRGGATKYLLHDVCVQVCCSIFIGMKSSSTMLLCLNWNVFNIYIQILSDYTLIMIYRSKMAR